MMSDEFKKLSLFSDGWQKSKRHKTVMRHISGIDEYGRNDVLSPASRLNRLESARTILSELLEEDDAAVEHNQAILERKGECVRAVIAFAKEQGFYEEETTRINPRTGRENKSKKFTTSAKWVGGLWDQVMRYVPQSAKVTSRELVAKHKKLLQEIEDKRMTAIREQQDSEDSKSRQKIDRKRLASIIRVGDKYEIESPESLDIYALMDILCSRDPYLNLAIAMNDTRNDWNDGFDAVRSALNRFNRDADEGAKKEAIIEDITDCLTSGESDGRIFRDTEWSYSKLYALADKELSEDYFKIAEYAE